MRKEKKLRKAKYRTVGNVCRFLSKIQNRALTEAEIDHIGDFYDKDKKRLLNHLKSVQEGLLNDGYGKIQVIQEKKDDISDQITESRRVRAVNDYIEVIFQIPQVHLSDIESTWAELNTICDTWRLFHVDFLLVSGTSNREQWLKTPQFMKMTALTSEEYEDEDDFIDGLVEYFREIGCRFTYEYDPNYKRLVFAFEYFTW